MTNSMCEVPIIERVPCAISLRRLCPDPKLHHKLHRVQLLCENELGRLLTVDNVAQLFATADRCHSERLKKV